MLKRLVWIVCFCGTRAMCVYCVEGVHECLFGTLLVIWYWLSVNGIMGHLQLRARL